MAGSAFSHVPQDVPFVESKYRRIQTKLPVPESVPMLEELYSVESNSMHGQMPVVWDRAVDFQVFDAWGNTWIDFTSTIFVTNAGHSNPRIVSALRDVIETPLLHTYTYANKWRFDYLRNLIARTPRQFEKAFLLSAGTEAVECGLKLMRLYGRKHGKRRGVIIGFDGNWHGRTLGAQMLASNKGQKDWIGYHDPNIIHLPFPYPWDEEAMTDPAGFFRRSMDLAIEQYGLDPDQDICGFLMETFQGWGAVFYPPEFVQAVSEFAKARNILLTFDEMQAGFGRTGKLFGYMHYGVEADLLCCGKGAGSGVPLSLVLGSAEVMDLPEIGSMSSTHSANPIVCAAGKATLDALFEDGLIENSATLGVVFQRELNRIKARFPDHLRIVNGKGLLAAVIFTDKTGTPLSTLCDRIALLCMQRGLLVVHTGRESIKLAPPLSIHEEALMDGISVLENAIADSIEGFAA